MHAKHTEHTLPWVTRAQWLYTLQQLGEQGEAVHNQSPQRSKVHNGQYEKESHIPKGSQRSRRTAQTEYGGVYDGDVVPDCWRGWLLYWINRDK